MARFGLAVRESRPMISRFAALALLASLPALGAEQATVTPLPRSAPEAQGIPSPAIKAFLEAAEAKIDALHSVMILRHGVVVAEGWWAPYEKADPHVMFSLSKTFTSTVLSPRPDGSYVGKVGKPAAGWTAYFVELTYPSGTAYPFKFTTEVSVIPDTLPYNWKDARPIIAPDGK